MRMKIEMKAKWTNVLIQAFDPIGEILYEEVVALAH